MHPSRQIARPASTFGSGCPNTCRFCEHNNPAGSNFCNKCGGQLNLLPCPSCGAVVNVTAKSCYQCHHRLSECTTDTPAPRLSAPQDFPPSPRRGSQGSDEEAIFAEITQSYDGISPRGTDNLDRPSPSSDVDRPDNLAPRLSAAQDFRPAPRQDSQESDAEAIFAEIKQLYDGISPGGTDNLDRPSPSSDVDRPDDLAPRLSAAQDFPPAPRQDSQESDAATTRHEIEKLYYSNLQRPTYYHDRPSPAAESDRPANLEVQLLGAEGDSVFRRRLPQTTIGIAILTAIVVLGYYEYHQRFFSDALRSLVVRREQRGNEGPASARAVRRDIATFKMIPARNTQHARTKQKTVVWDPQKVNSFWKVVMGKTSDVLANLVAKTPGPGAAPALEPAAAPAPEPAHMPTPKTKKSAPVPAKSVAVPASPPRKKTTSVPISAFERELGSATAPAVVSFAISPWGEIYVDGHKRGVNPPMLELELGPGQYEIEVRNTTFPAHAQTIKVQAGMHIKIKHHFR